MSEQLALQKIFVQRPAVDREKSPVFAQAVVMERPRDDLLACPGFSAQQHGGIGVRDQLHLTAEIAHRGAGRRQIGEPMLRGQFAAQLHVLGEQRGLVPLGPQ